ncbi:MAG: hypothetical protein QM811_02840 [Pirellulales bacterium]
MTQLPDDPRFHAPLISETSEPLLFTVLHPHFDPLRNLTLALAVRANDAVRRDDRAAAWRDLRTAYKLIDSRTTRAAAVGSTAGRESRTTHSTGVRRADPRSRRASHAARVRRSRTGVSGRAQTAPRARKRSSKASIFCFSISSRRSRSTASNIKTPSVPANRCSPFRFANAPRSITTCC